MSRPGIWDDDSVSEFDMIAEDAENAEQLAEEYSSQSDVIEASPDQLEEINEDSAFELDHTESNVIYNARLRLEQAKLYEMLVNHNLFEGVEASPDAIKKVQNEIKYFIVKRLEILMGLREPTARPAAAVDLPFNDVEIDFLKQLAYKGTFGRSSESVATQQPAIKAVTKTVPSPAQKLKAITAKQPVIKPPAPPAPVVPTKEPPKVQQKKTVAAQPTAPVKQNVQKNVQPRKPVEKPKLRESGMGRPLSEAEAIEIAKNDLKTTSGKPFHLMSAKEKAAKIAEVNARNRRPQAVGVLPMPDASQLEMKYMMQQQSGAHSKDSMKQFNSTLATVLASKKTRGVDDE